MKITHHTLDRGGYLWKKRGFSRSSIALNHEMIGVSRLIAIVMSLISGELLATLFSVMLRFGLNPTETRPLLMSSISILRRDPVL